MKKTLLLGLALFVMLSAASCNGSINSPGGFKSKIPEFDEVRIDYGGGSTWDIDIESYEINGDMIYIEGEDGQKVLTSLSNCTLVAYDGN